MSSNGKLGLWVGSSPAPFESFQKGLQRLKEEGVNFLLLEEVKKNACRKESSERPYLAGEDQSKVKTFVQLWNDPHVRNILGVRGGYGTLRLLPLLSKEKLSSKVNKMLWGFSDFTILQNYLYTRCKRPWVHSPFLSSQSFFDPSGVEKNSFDFFETQKKTQKSEFKVRLLCGSLDDLKKITKKKHVMLGGNLASLVSMIGTPWEPISKAPHYLFLEDVNERPHRVDRMLNQLLHSKMFKKTKLIVLGSFDEKNGEKIFPLIKKWGDENKVTILRGLHVGHDRPNMAIYMGTPVEILAASEERLLLHIQKPIL